MLSLALLAACVGDSSTTTDAGVDSSTNDSASDVAIKDSATDSGITDAATEQGAWSPIQLSGLALWLTGDTAVQDINSKIATWSDQSTHHNDATQSTEALAPYFATTPINGHKAVHFDGTAHTGLAIADATSLQWSQSFVVEIVIRPNAPTVIGTLYQKQSQVSPYSGPVINLFGLAVSNPAYVGFQLDNASTLGSKTTTAVTEPAADAGALVAHRIHVSWDGTSTAAVQVGKNAPLTGTFGSTGLAAVGSEAYIGCNQPDSGLTLCYWGDIAEIAALAGATINPADISMLESYLDTKYGL
jgi:hypothetical protein